MRFQRFFNWRGLNVNRYDYRYISGESVNASKYDIVEAVAKLQFLQQQPLKNACFAAFRRENAGAWAKLTEFCNKLEYIKVKHT